MNKVPLVSQDSLKVYLKSSMVSLKFFCFCFQTRSSSDSQPIETLAQTEESITTEVDVQVSPLGSTELQIPFTDVYAQQAPTEHEEKQEENLDEKVDQDQEEVSGVGEVNLSVVSEGVSQEYALSSTLPQAEEDEVP